MGAELIVLFYHLVLLLLMYDLIDFDTGSIIRGESSIDELGSDLLDLLIETASGAYKPKAVILGQDDFLPWKRGVSL